MSAFDQMYYRGQKQALSLRMLVHSQSYRRQQGFLAHSGEAKAVFVSSLFTSLAAVILV